MTILQILQLIFTTDTVKYPTVIFLIKTSVKYPNSIFHPFIEMKKYISFLRTRIVIKVLQIIFILFLGWGVGYFSFLPPLLYVKYPVRPESTCTDT